MDESAAVLHQRLLSIGNVFHSFCVQNNLKYYMLGGTMLGAVRHKGFIPWDDDMDFGMPREDYNRFIQLAKSGLPYPFEIKYYGNTSNSPIHYVKLIDGSTTLIEDSYHDYVEGLYIDIFPLDGANETVADRIRFSRIMLLQRMIINHCTTREKQSLWRKGFKRFSKALNLERLHNKIEKLMTKRGLSSSTHIANYLGAWGKKEIMPKRIMEETTLYQFEDTQFFGASDYHSYLTSLYGEYMQLPPVEKRVFRHNYHYLNFDLPYLEYVNGEKQN